MKQTLIGVMGVLATVAMLGMTGVQFAGPHDSTPECCQKHEGCCPGASCCKGGSHSHMEHCPLLRGR